MRRIESCSPGSGATLVDDIENSGFTIADVADMHADPVMVIAGVATLLNLGDPQVPSLYQKEGAEKYSTPYREIQSNPGEGHPAFDTTAGQDWHVDGLLDEIGMIKTTILYCVRPAHSGGETQVFNAIAAFDELRRTDPEAGEAFLDPAVLERRATITAVDAAAVGPAFAVTPDGELSTRFADNSTCVWNHAAGREGSLERGLEFLRKAAKAPRYQKSIRLKSGEALIFRNDRIVHGRTAYMDDANSRRLLVRSLYLKAPAT